VGPVQNSHPIPSSCTHLVKFFAIIVRFPPVKVIPEKSELLSIIDILSFQSKFIAFPVLPFPFNICGHPEFPQQFTLIPEL
jgi:hypothetical protein